MADDVESALTRSRPTRPCESEPRQADSTDSRTHSRRGPRRFFPRNHLSRIPIRGYAHVDATGKFCHPCVLSVFLSPLSRRSGRALGSSNDKSVLTFADVDSHSRHSDSGSAKEKRKKKKRKNAAHVHLNVISNRFPRIAVSRASLAHRHDAAQT